MADIITKLDNCPFVYRDRLNIPSNVNFGLEFELDKINYDEVYKLIRSRMGGNWTVKTDDSLTKGCNAEVVSPVLRNNKETWILLRKMGELLEKLNPSYDKCSFQVNFDGSLIPSVEDRVRFLKLYAMYEDIIYRFSKGEDSNYRDSLEMYASPIVLSLRGVLSISDNAVVDMFTDQKRYGVTFKTKNDLIEFRTPNMSNNPIFFQNYINTFYHLLACVASKKYDRREVDEYIDRFSKIYLLEGYELEKRDKALRLCKMIFPKTLDQTNFMHQYLGR